MLEVGSVKMPDPRSLLSCATEQLRQPAPAVRGSGGSNLGLVLTDKGRDMEAEECFRRALVIDQAMRGVPRNNGG